MVDQQIQDELLAELGHMTPEEQQRVLHFARTLAHTLVIGTDGKDMLRFSGFINHGDLELMQRAIEDECEQLDTNEW